MKIDPIAPLPLNPQSGPVEVCWETTVFLCPGCHNRLTLIFLSTLIRMPTLPFRWHVICLQKVNFFKRLMMKTSWKIMPSKNSQKNDFYIKHCTFEWHDVSIIPKLLANYGQYLTLYERINLGSYLIVYIYTTGQLIHTKESFKSSINIKDLWMVQECHRLPDRWFWVSPIGIEKLFFWDVRLINVIISTVILPRFHHQTVFNIHLISCFGF